MLSDYPHKYEDYRSHQCRKQISEPTEETVEEVKVEEVKEEKVDVKPEPKPVEQKPEPPKVDPEKARQVSFNHWKVLFTFFYYYFLIS